MSRTIAAAVEDALRRANEHDDALGVYLTRFDAYARRRAAELDSAGPGGALHGVLVGVKDNIAVSEGPTTAQSTVLDGDWGREKDAPVVERLKAAGAIVVGKTTMHEFAIGHPEPPGRFPEARNPWALDRYAGGSSSGSAVGVAADYFPIALGTDTGGSLRIPAALCGVAALMPTYGRVPLAGCVPLAYSIDRIGPIARTMRELSVVLETIADPGELPVTDLLDGTLTGVRIGVDRVHHFPEDADPAVLPAFEESLAVLRRTGAEIVEVVLPHWDEAAAAHAVIEGAESLAYHRADLRERWDEYTPWARLAFSRGAMVSGADYVQAQRVRRVVQRALARTFSDVDLVASPTLGVGAVPLEELYAGATSVLGLFKFIYTRYWNCVGNPAMTLPMGFNGDGLPLGLQLAARPFDEAVLLRAGHAFQRETGWHEQRPAARNGAMA